MSAVETKIYKRWCFLVADLSTLWCFSTQRMAVNLGYDADTDACRWFTAFIYTFLSNVTATYILCNTLS